MASISLGQNGMVYASRIVGGNGVYMPDATTILNKTGLATSDTWGTAQLAQLDTGDGFKAPAGMDIKIQFVGNTGEGVVQEYDPVTTTWTTIKTIDDAEAHVIQAPMGPFRVGVVTDTNCTYVQLKAAGF
jgi:hypothetical protein